MGTTYYGQHSGIVLTSGFVTKNPVTIAADGTITGAVYGANYAWTVTNLGTVDAIGTASYGVVLEAGGSVVNGASGATTALIEGASGGVLIAGGSGSVTNFGTINGATTGLTSGVSIAGTGTVDNFGTIGGVSISGTGTVTNEAGGQIFGFVAEGISFGRDPGSVVNAGTIGGVFLASGGSVTNEVGGVINDAFLGFNIYSPGIYSGQGATSVTNAGTIYGIYIQDGGSIVNQPGGMIDDVALRVGFRNFFSGVLIAGGSGQVDNSGTIQGVTLKAGGNVVNETSGVVVPAFSADAIHIAGPAVVTNYGSISGSIGIDLTQSNGAADTLTNGGLIVGTYGTAVAFGGGNDLLRIEPGAGFGGVVDGGGGSNIAELPATGGTGTMTGIGAVFENFTIDVDAGASWVWAGSNTLGPGTVLNVAGALTVSGSLTNTTVIDVTGALADQGSVLNSGLIDGAVGVSGGGVLNNAAGATINGEVFGTGDATVANFGTIGSGGTAVAFSGSGDVLVYEPGGVFNGIVEGGGNTLELPATGGRGYLTGLGTSFVDFGAVVVDPGAQWVLFGYNNLGGGSVVLDNGAYAQNAAGAVLTGVGTVVTATGAASFTNYGVVSDTGATGVGVNLTAGGTVVNQPGAEISGYYGGIFVEGGAGVVINRGSIGGTDNAYAIGVYLGAGGVVGNSSRITALSGSGTGVAINGSGYVTNGGLIAGAHVGVELFAGPATLVNYGRIAGTGGYGVGVYLAADGSTLTNAGRIVGRGGTAVYLAGSYDTLVMDPGASFVGVVGAGGSGDTLELAAGTGTLKGLGSKFAGFGTVKIDPGGTWDIRGGEGSFVNDGTALVDGTVVFDALATDPSNQGLVDILHGSTGEFAGAVSRTQTVEFADGTGTALLDRPKGFHATFLGFTEGDVIDLIGKSVDGLSYANHQLVLTEGGHLVADLHFAGHYTASEFALAPDGSGGTYVTLSGATAAADLWKMKS